MKTRELVCHCNTHGCIDISTTMKTDGPLARLWNVDGMVEVTCSVEVNFESIAFGFIRVLIELLVKTQKAAR